jgi:hypothetical protein
MVFIKSSCIFVLMLKRILASGLIVLILLSGYSRVYQYAAYALNKNYITRALCLNTAKPQMHCNGKCYLAKKIKEAEQNEQRSEQSYSKKFSSENFVKPDNNFLFLAGPTGKTQFSEMKVKASASGIFIFHPPQLAAILS